MFAIGVDTKEAEKLAATAAIGTSDAYHHNAPVAICANPCDKIVSRSSVSNCCNASSDITTVGAGNP